jgi:RNA polymerase sigma-70 factor (ECF subfamily)
MTIDELYRRHGHLVYRRARWLLGNDDDARDVTQDVFLKLHADGSRFAGRSSVVTYLYSVTTHACLNRLRTARTRARLLGVEAERWARTANATTEARTLAREVLAALSEDEAALAVYLYCDELSHSEIGQLLGYTGRHVWNLAQRLAQRIKDIEPERDCA